MKKIVYLIFIMAFVLTSQTVSADTSKNSVAGVAQPTIQEKTDLKNTDVKKSDEIPEETKISAPQTFDYSKPEETNKITELLKNIGFYHSDEISDEQKIKKLVTKMANNYNTRNIEQLKLCFSENYVSADGFDKETYFKLVSDGWNIYKDLKYETVLNKIEINGSYATVYVTETASGETNKGIKDVAGTGTLNTISNSVYYLQKYGKEWLIDTDFMASELTTIKYGSAKNVPMSINAPYTINPKQLYTVTLKVDKPKNTILLASISNEPYIYPQVEPSEVFRGIEKSGSLERILTANASNKNEYVVASVGFTSALLKEDKTFDIKVTGVAFLMQRVNVTAKSLKVK